MFFWCDSLVEAPEIPAEVTDCDCMFNGCSSLQNYSLDNVISKRNKIYCNCPPIIQEIDSFTQKIKERNQLNG